MVKIILHNKPLIFQPLTLIGLKIDFFKSFFFPCKLNVIFLSLSFFLVRSVQKPKNSHKSVSLLCHNSKGIYHPLIKKFNIQKVLQLHVLLVFFGPFQALHRLFRRENFCARYPNKNFTLIKKNGKHFMIYRIS